MVLVPYKAARTQSGKSQVCEFGGLEAKVKQANRNFQYVSPDQSSWSAYSVYHLLILIWRIIREKKERRNRKGRGDIFCSPGGFIRQGSLIEDFNTIPANLSRELFRIQSELKTDQITLKQVGDLRVLLTARKRKENKVILTMTINAKSQWQCFGRRSRKRMLHQRQMRKSVITIVRRFIQLTQCPLHGR